jgi:DNA polymerase/3'-5' exonuclease PolX
MTNNILTAFNDHFIEFISDVHQVFPDDVDVLTAKNSLIQIRKVNPKMIVKIWKTFIVDKYKSEIESGNIDFFINKDYSNDLASAQNSDKIMESINRLREPIKNMGIEDQKKTMKYIQNLSKLSLMCE